MYISDSKHLNLFVSCPSLFHWLLCPTLWLATSVYMHQVHIYHLYH